MASRRAREVLGTEVLCPDEVLGTRYLIQVCHWPDARQPRCQFSIGPPSHGNAAKAGIPLIVRRQGVRDQVEPNPVERVERHGPDTPALD